MSVASTRYEPWRSKGVNLDNAFTKSPTELDAELTTAMDMMPVRMPVPVLLATGLADRIMPPQRQYAAALCSTGSKVVYSVYPRILHNGIVNAAFDDELTLVQQMLGAKPITSNCEPLTSPGPPETATAGLQFND